MAADWQPTLLKPPTQARQSACPSPFATRHPVGTAAATRGFNSGNPEIVMPSQMPPVPPANRSPKGPGAAPKVSKNTAPDEPAPENVEQQGERANVKQNTTNQDHKHRR
jgi:hypothetical protein